MSTELQEPCEILEWDTSFFGVKIARVRGSSLNDEHVEDINRWCIQRDVNCLYFLARSDDSITSMFAEDNSFRLVDIRMTFVSRETHKRNCASDIEKAPFPVRLVLAEDIPILQRIARESYRLSRFYFDRNFPDHLCDAFYETWITKSCEGYATAVLVAKENRNAVGFVSCHLDQNHSGHIGLVGVSSHMQGIGLGKILVSAALEWFFSHNASEIHVTTQGRNVPAQRLYQRLGFVTDTVDLWYHKWYEK